MQRFIRINKISSPPNIILTGFMGTGKSAIGRFLAQRWNFRFLDTDKLIQTRTHRTIPEIFAKDGEAAFRELEKKCVNDWLPASKTVISTGGGIVTIPGIIEKLKERGIVIALFASPETILQRTSENKNRPLLQVDEDPLERILHLLKKREKAYMNSGVNVLTDGYSIGEIEHIIRRIYCKEVLTKLKIEDSSK